MSAIQQLFESGVQAQQKQQWQIAIEKYHQLLRLQPDYLSALINISSAYRQTQQLSPAKKYYQQAIDHPDAGFEVWYNYANFCVSTGNTDQAEEYYALVIKNQPDHALSHYRLGSIARDKQQWQTAKQYYLQTISLMPNHANAYLDLGNSYRQLGELQSALQSYQKSVQINPSWQGHYSLARIYDQQDQTDLFQQHYRLALASCDRSYIVHYNLAQTRFDNGQYQGAKQQYQLALKAEQHHFPSQLGLAASLMHLKQDHQAKPLFLQLTESSNVVQLSELARVMWEYKYFHEAIKVLQKMVQLRPDLYDTHLNLAKAYVQNWNLSKAEKHLQDSLAINPACKEADDLLASIYVKQGQCDKSIDLHQQTIQREGNDSSAVSSLLFTLLYSTEYTAQQKAKKHRLLMDNWVNHSTETTAFNNSKQPQRRLRIGYISADFRDQHPVGIFVQPVLQHHDQQQFEIYCYYNTRTYDASTHTIKALVSHWTDVANWSDERLQQQIRQNQIDILIDLSGHTAKNRLQLFAKRAAPIQLTWLGYPHSTGLSTMDYLLADSITCPPENDALCSETVLRLASHCVFCFPVTDEYPAYQPRPKKQSDQSITFGSFNNLTKVNDKTLALWANVLLSIDHAKLKLKTPSFTDKACIQKIQDFFIQQGIAKDRLIFSGPSGLKEMMQEYTQIDIALDTLPYNGGTTTLQALWMGAPVITLAGKNFCGRMGASIMHFLNRPEWIAETEKEYINIAIEYAHSRDKLQTIKHQLRNQMIQSPLCDNAGFTLQLEQQLRIIWKHYCEQ